jgi:hypothetical protein
VSGEATRKGDYLPPAVHGTKDDWHVLIVRDDDPADGFHEWLHPQSCPVSINSRGEVSYECHTASDLLNAGHDGLFERDGTLCVGVWLVHPWVEMLRGLDWTEYDGGWTVIRLAEAPYEAAHIASDAAVEP